MAEAHPVGFRWVMKAKEHGATIIHVDPRFSRTSALADIWLPIRAGTDIVFLGGLIRHLIEHNLYFHEYVVHYTNASCILSDEYRDPEDNGDGYFSGWNEEKRAYEGDSWVYKGGDLSRPLARSYVARSAMCFSKIKTTFLPLHAGDGRENLRHSARPFSQSRALSRCCIWPGEDRRGLLRSRLDAAFQGSADHSNGCDFAIAAWKYRPTRRRNSRLARSCLNPGVD